MIAGGSGDTIVRCVNRIPVSPTAGSVRQLVPVPPSHPKPPGTPVDPSPAGTDIISPQPLWSPTNTAFSARSSAVIRSVVIVFTDACDSRPPLRAAIIDANFQRSSTVDTSQPAPFGIFGGADHHPSGRSSS